MKDLIDELRLAADVKCDDFPELLLRAVDVIESQAREIERLNAVGLANEKLTQRIKELKAQAGGVVLPEPMKRGEEGGSGEYGAAMIRGYNACLREVARLNQPASAGEQCDTCHDQGEVWTGKNKSFGCMSMQPPDPIMEACPQCSGESVSDDRAAFAEYLKDCEVHDLDPDISGAFHFAWQARSALSANHSEQVREVPCVQITGHLDEIDAPAWEFINAEARKLGPITGSIDSYGLSRPNGGQPNGGVVVLWNGQKIHAVALAVRDAMNRTVCIRLLAAAPSAGSQKEQGE